MNQPSAEELSKTFPAEEFSAKHYTCPVCGYRLPETIRFSSLPEEWLCPICRTKKKEFRLL